MARPNKNGKGGLPTRSFAGIPRIVMNTDDYKNLKGNAIKLLLEFAYQYRGNNNGDLSAPFSHMRKRGFRSKETLGNALKSLQDANLIIKTREGMFLNPGGRCALYALTWQPIDECKGKHDMNSTITPVRKFSFKNQ
jgi:hypothetical protein